MVPIVKPSILSLAGSTPDLSNTFFTASSIPVVISDVVACLKDATTPLEAGSFALVISTMTPSVLVPGDGMSLYGRLNDL